MHMFLGRHVLIYCKPLEMHIKDMLIFFLLFNYMDNVILAWTTLLHIFVDPTVRPKHSTWHFWKPCVTLRPFVKYVNFNHIMPTRYQAAGPGVTRPWGPGWSTWNLKTGNKKIYLTPFQLLQKKKNANLPNYLLEGYVPGRVYPCFSFPNVSFRGCWSPQNASRYVRFPSFWTINAGCAIFFWTHDDLIPTGNWSRRNLPPQIISYGINFSIFHVISCHYYLPNIIFIHHHKCQGLSPFPQIFFGLLTIRDFPPKQVGEKKNTNANFSVESRWVPTRRSSLSLPRGA